MLVLRRVAWIADGRGPPLPSIAESCELVTDADFLELLSRRACRFHAWPGARPRAGWHERGHGTRLPPHRQRHGEGDRSGNPMAGNAGERHARDHREDLILRHRPLTNVDNRCAAEMVNQLVN
jgi:hypothetical protein